MRPTVVQFGAGNIGRGFMGPIYTDAGYEVVFVDVAPAVVEGLNERRSYPLRLAGPDRFGDVTIEPVRAVDGRDRDAVAAELARCEFACTAVGVPALPHVTPALAAGLRARERPLNVILCENQLQCSDLLRGYLEPLADPEQLARLGLVESVVSRMVPIVPDELRAQDPLIVIAEDYPVLPVDATGFLGDAPAVPALKLVERFPAYVERKLFVHNGGHAASAYHGFLGGYEFIFQALANPEVRASVSGAMDEACEALARKHGFDRGELRAHRDDLIRRFENPALRDTVFRVGRDPLRKLRVDDRLVGAGLTCLDWDVEPEQISRAIAAALRFRPEGDPAAHQLAETVDTEGVAAALERYTGLRPDSELGRRVLSSYHR